MGPKSCKVTHILSGLATEADPEPSGSHGAGRKCLKNTPQIIPSFAIFLDKNRFTHRFNQKEAR